MLRSVGCERRRPSKAGSVAIESSDPDFAATKVVWERYRDLTRFLHSSRIALNREAALWNTLQLSAPENVGITTPSLGGVGSYEVTVAEHVAALQDFETMSGLVLLGSCSLAEALTRLRLGVDKLDRSGIETWGNEALQRNNRSFADLGDNCGVLVEAYVARNIYAHGQSVWSQNDVNRVANSGGTPPPVGARLEVANRLEAYRQAIKQYMRLTGMTI